MDSDAAASATASSRRASSAARAGPLVLQAPKPAGFGRGPFAVRDHRRLVVAEPAQQPVDLAQARLEPRERVRVVVHGLGQGPDLGRHVLQLGLEPGQAIREGCPAIIEAGQGSKLVLGKGHPLAGAASLREDRLACRDRPPGDRLSVLCRGQLARDLVRLALAQAPGLDLLRLVLGDLEPAQQLPRVHRQLRERGPVLPPAIHGPGDGGPRLAVPAERVQQVPLPVLVEEALLVVLAVDLHQPGRRLREPSRGHRLVVEAGRGPARCGDLAHGDHGLGEPVEQGLHARTAPRRAGPAWYRPGRPSPGPAHRSAGSCPPRSRR